MRILWGSNYTVNSSYAYEARRAVPRLLRSGHKVTVFDIRNGGGSTSQVGDITILAAALDPVGNDIIPQHYHASHSDVFITLCDVWAFQDPVMRQVNWYPWVPVDHSPTPPAVAEVLKASKGAIAMSRYGEARLRELEGLDVMYWPLSVDPKIWQPGDMTAARARLNIDRNDFLVSFVGVNDSNPSRKGIPELMAAWSIFHKRHPASKLYLHTTLLGNMPIAGARNGVDINWLTKTFGVDPLSIIIPDQYKIRTGIPASELALYAQASDMLVLPSRGEGFGLPLIEFQRAGCPVATTDFASGAELCASGWLIDYEVEWSWQNATSARPGIASIVDKLELGFAERGNPKHRADAVNFAREYDVDYVFDKYAVPIMNRISENLILSAKSATA